MTNIATAGPPRHAGVEQLRASHSRESNRLWTKISVEHASSVRLREAVGDLGDQPQRATGIHRAPAHLTSKGRAGDKLVGQIARVVNVPDVEERRNVRMRQHGSRARLRPQRPGALDHRRWSPAKSSVPPSDQPCGSWRDTPARGLLTDDLAQVVVRDGLFSHAPFPGGREGRSSTRLGRLRAGIAMRSMTTCATSSGAMAQLSFALDPRPKSVATEPGIT